MKSPISKKLGRPHVGVTNGYGLQRWDFNWWKGDIRMFTEWVLSPLLWYIMIEELMDERERKGYNLAGYTRHLSILEKSIIKKIDHPNYKVTTITRLSSNLMHQYSMCRFWWQLYSQFLFTRHNNFIRTFKKVPLMDNLFMQNFLY